MTTGGSDPLSYYTAEPQRPFSGRRAGSITFGVVAIVTGSICGCPSLVTPLARFMTGAHARHPVRPGIIISVALLYSAVAAGLIALGIGAVRLRRWVRPLVLTVGTLIVFYGLLVVAVTVAQAPAAFRRAADAGARPGVVSPLPPGVMVGVMVVFETLFMVALPGAYIWFFHGDEARRMLEHYDPRPRWTDRCPVPVLGVAVGLTMVAVAALASVPQGLVAVFGTLLTGPPAVAVFVVEAGAALVLARLVYLRRPAGWWGTLAFVAVYSVGSALTFLRGDRAEQYRRAGLSESEVSAIRHSRSGASLVIWLVAAVAAFAYLAWVRGSFFGGEGRKTQT